MTVEIRALLPDDRREAFRSGDQSLDLFFHRYAGQNQFRHHIGVTYVAAEQDTLLGFVTVSPGILDAEDLPSGRRMPPYPLPILRIARLAAHADAREMGIGKALLRFCLELAERMKVELGCVGVLVDAMPDVEPFYEQFGFATVGAVEGKGYRIPATTLMYLPLGAVPRSQ